MAMFCSIRTIKKNSKYTYQKGFTLIELVMVIVLIGVLSVGARSLFSSKDAYVDYLAKERLLSMGLLAQQFALGVSAQEVAIPGSTPAPPGDPADIQISRTVDGDLSFTLRKHNAEVQRYQLEQPLPSISVDGVALAVGSTVTLVWNQSADMDDGNNHKVTIAGASTFRVCFSASGFTYETAGVCP